MKVVEIGSYGWSLLRDGDDWIFDVLCSHSAVDYDFIMKLNASEVAAYQKEGTKYLERLAYEVHYSAPGVLGTTSMFASRKLTAELRKPVDQAIEQYFQERKSGA